MSTSAVKMLAPGDYVTITHRHAYSCLPTVDVVEVEKARQTSKQTILTLTDGRTLNQAPDGKIDWREYKDSLSGSRHVRAWEPSDSELTDKIRVARMILSAVKKDDNVLLRLPVDKLRELNELLHAPDAPKNG